MKVWKFGLAFIAVGAAGYAGGAKWGPTVGGIGILVLAAWFWAGA